MLKNKNEQNKWKQVYEIKINKERKKEESTRTRTIFGQIIFIMYTSPDQYF